MIGHGIRLCEDSETADHEIENLEPFYHRLVIRHGFYVDNVFMRGQKISLWREENDYKCETQEGFCNSTHFITEAKFGFRGLEFFEEWNSEIVGLGKEFFCFNNTKRNPNQPDQAQGHLVETAIVFKNTDTNTFFEHVTLIQNTGCKVEIGATGNDEDFLNYACHFEVYYL